MGPAGAETTIVLLGHIGTVPGAIPVRIEETPAGPALTAAAASMPRAHWPRQLAAVARAGAAWAAEQNVRLVVVGAVEEEAASSKGARFIRDRFDGRSEPIPNACIIGEPSGWQRHPGLQGQGIGGDRRLPNQWRIRRDQMRAWRPSPSIFGIWLAALAQSHNHGIEKTFDQVSPSLRRLQTFTDEQIHDHVIAQAGIRLPHGLTLLHLRKPLVHGRRHAGSSIWMVCPIRRQRRSSRLCSPWRGR